MTASGEDDSSQAEGVRSSRWTRRQTAEDRPGQSRAEQGRVQVCVDVARAWKAEQRNTTPVDTGPPATAAATLKWTAWRLIVVWVVMWENNQKGEQAGRETGEAVGVVQMGWVDAGAGEGRASRPTVTARPRPPPHRGTTRVSRRAAESQRRGGEALDAETRQKRVWRGQGRRQTRRKRLRRGGDLESV